MWLGLIIDFDFNPYITRVVSLIKYTIDDIIGSNLQLLGPIGLNSAITWVSLWTF